VAVRSRLEQISVRAELRILRLVKLWSSPVKVVGFVVNSPCCGLCPVLGCLPPIVHASGQRLTCFWV
jgi:hypothetical protein